MSRNSFKWLIRNAIICIYLCLTAHNPCVAHVCVCVCVHITFGCFSKFTCYICTQFTHSSYEYDLKCNTRSVTMKQPACDAYIYSNYKNEYTLRFCYCFPPSEKNMKFLWKKIEHTLFLLLLF